MSGASIVISITVGKVTIVALFVIVALQDNISADQGRAAKQRNHNHQENKFGAWFHGIFPLAIL
jgi:hypothetical protein